MLTIPLRARPSYVQEVTLENVAYRMVVNWNTRGEYFALDIETAEGTLLIAGLKLALNAPLLRKHPGRGLPPGELLVVDPGGGVDKISYMDIEDRIELVYVTEAEYAAI